MIFACSKSSADFMFNIPNLVPRVSHLNAWGERGSRDKILTKPPLPSLDKLSSPRLWETRDQTLPGSLLARPRR